MRTLQKTVRAAYLENKNWKQELFSFLRNYRATPHSTTGISPAELLFGRKFITKLPELVPPSPSRARIEQADQTKKEKMKKCADAASNAKPHKHQVGDTVLVRQNRVNKLTSPYRKDPYTIIEIKGSMITAKSTNGHIITRNSSQFKSFQRRNSGLDSDDMDNDPLEDEEFMDQFTEPPTAERRYPIRENRRPPERLTMEYEH